MAVGPITGRPFSAARPLLDPGRLPAAAKVPGLLAAIPPSRSGLLVADTGTQPQSAYRAGQEISHPSIANASQLFGNTPGAIAGYLAPMAGAGIGLTAGLGPAIAASLAAGGLIYIMRDGHRNKIAGYGRGGTSFGIIPSDQFVTHATGHKLSRPNYSDWFNSNDELSRDEPRRGTITLEDQIDELPRFIEDGTPKDEVETLVDSVIQAIHNFGRRGSPLTQGDLDIVAQECRKYLREKFPQIAQNFHHIGGATREGSGKPLDYLSEWYLPGPNGQRRGSSYPDLSWLYDPSGKGFDPGRRLHDTGHINSQTTTPLGTAISRERLSFQNLIRNAASWFNGNGRARVSALAKRFPLESPRSFRERASRACQRLFEDWANEILAAP
ncbi:MAG: hypothetical protein U1E53_23150 [Dongiaceae bacterium]